MAIFDKVKDVINKFVETESFDNRTGRLISRQINSCLIENNQVNNVNIEVIKKQNKTLSDKITHLTIHNKKLKKEVSKLENQIRSFKNNDNAFVVHSNEKDKKGKTLFKLYIHPLFIVVVIYLIIVGFMLKYMTNIILKNTIKNYDVIDFKSFDEIKYDMYDYVNLLKHYMKDFNDKYGYVLNQTLNEFMNKLNDYSKIYKNDYIDNVSVFNYRDGNNFNNTYEMCVLYNKHFNNTY